MARSARPHGLIVGPARAPNAHGVTPRRPLDRMRPCSDLYPTIRIGSPLLWRLAVNWVAEFLTRPSWQQQVRLQIAEIKAAHESATPPPRVADPWERRLADLAGELHDDGYERVATFVVFEHLG